MDDFFMKFLEKYNKEILYFGIALNISILIRVIFG